MNRILGGLIVLVLVALAAAYVASPIYAFHQLKDAAETGDRERLEALVDFPAVKDDLKRQVDSGATKLARRAQGVGYPIAAVLGAVGAALGDKAVDKLVTPDAISAMVQYGETPREHRKDAAKPSASSDEGAGPGPTRVRFAYLSPDRFRARVAPASEPTHGIDLILGRQGLFSWRLEAIELPK
jgi:hypothetical protein